MKRAALVLVLLVAGCSSSSKAGGDSGVKTVQSVADKLGCSVTVDSAADRVALASDTGDCSFSGNTVHLATFTNNTVRDNFVKIAAQTAGVRAQVADREVAYGENAATADALKEKLGGDVRTS